MNLKASIVSDIVSFESLKIEWADLLGRSNSESVFLTWSWLYTWWRKFQGDRILCIVIVRDHFDALVGIAPFCIKNKWNRFPVKTLSFLGISPISSDYLDIIVDPNHEEEISTVIFKKLLSSDVSWDCMEITDTLNTSSVFKNFKKLAAIEHFIIKEGLSAVCPYLSLDSSQDVMMKKFESKLRSTITRRTKKLEKMGVKLKLENKEEDLVSSMNKLFELHQKCWNERGEKGNFSNDLINSFHIDVSKHLLADDCLRLYALQIEESTIATLYAYQYKNTMFYYQSGFDTDWSSYSPGTVLMWKCISDAIDRGVKKFDYLRGSESYKSLWSDHSRNTHTIILIPPGSFKMRKFFLLDRTLKRLRTMVKKLILIFYSKE